MSISARVASPTNIGRHQLDVYGTRSRAPPLATLTQPGPHGLSRAVIPVLIEGQSAGALVDTESTESYVDMGLIRRHSWPILGGSRRIFMASQSLWMRTKVTCHVTRNNLAERNLKKPLSFGKKAKDQAYILPSETFHEFNCPSCMELQGTNPAECDEGEIQLPECRSVCCSVSLNELSERNLVVRRRSLQRQGSRYKFPLGTKVNFHCKEDHSSDTPLQIVCGNEHFNLPRCAPDFCVLQTSDFENNYLQVPEDYKKMQFMWSFYDFRLPRDKPVILKCKRDYVTSEPLTVTCKDGVVELPKCRTVCSMPDVPGNVEFSVLYTNINELGIIFPSALTFSCKFDFTTLYGSNHSKCMENGIWSYEAPTCISETCSPQLAWNDNDELIHRNETFHQAMCLVTSKQLVDRKLNEPSSFRNSWREKDRAFFLPPDTSYTFNCRLCMEIRGTNPTECHDGVIDLPNCQAVCCSVQEFQLAERRLKVPQEFQVTGSTYTVPLDTNVTFHCKQDHMLYGPVQRTCRDGHLSMPSCTQDSDRTCMISQGSLNNNNLRIPPIYQYVDIGGSYHYKVPEGENVNFFCYSGSTPNRERTCTGGVIDLPICETGCKSWLINHGGIRSWLSKSFEIIVSCAARHLSYAHKIRCLNTGPEAEIQCCPRDPKITDGTLEVIRPVYRFCQLIIQARARCNIGTRLVGSEMITCRGSRWPTETLSCQPDGIKNNQTLQWNVSLSEDADMQEEDGGRLIFRAKHLREARITWLGSAVRESLFLCYTGKIYWRLKVLMENTFIEKDGRDNHDCMELFVESKKLELHLQFHEFSFIFLTQVDEKRNLYRLLL
uniref:sushi, von Willebrand factor type A, EGF and pentraxin domain-containing protein 1-like isoform X3 n=1 Tax=Myxine glutinosa TaxID=7769 RepID=UPI00358DF114